MHESQVALFAYFGLAAFLGATILVVRLVQRKLRRDIPYRFAKGIDKLAEQTLILVSIGMGIYFVVTFYQEITPEEINLADKPLQSFELAPYAKLVRCEQHPECKLTADELSQLESYEQRLKDHHDGASWRGETK